MQCHIHFGTKPSECSVPGTVPLDWDWPQVTCCRPRLAVTIRLDSTALATETSAQNTCVTHHEGGGPRRS